MKLPLPNSPSALRLSLKSILASNQTEINNKLNLIKICLINFCKEDENDDFKINEKKLYWAYFLKIVQFLFYFEFFEIQSKTIIICNYHPNQSTVYKGPAL